MIIPCENCGKKYVEFEDILCDSCAAEMDEIVLPDDDEDAGKDEPEEEDDEPIDFVEERVY